MSMGTNGKPIGNQWETPKELNENAMGTQPENDGETAGKTMAESLGNK